MKVGASLPLIQLLVDAAITPAKRYLAERSEVLESKLSLTAYLTACLGRTLAAHPEIHQIHSWSGRLVAFDDVDIGVLIETQLLGRQMPIIHVIRNAHRRSVEDITAELRLVQQQPLRSPVLRHAHRLKWVPWIPGCVRRTAVRLMRRWPTVMKRSAGTAVITTLGNLGLRGYVLPVPTIYNLTLAVGGISTVDGRDLLHLCVAGNHQTIDGGPLTRFTTALLEAIEQPAALAAF